MLKLYRRSPGKFEYWEAWCHRRAITVHWGEVGTRGETRHVRLGGSQDPEAKLAALAAPHQATGFSIIEFDQHDVLIVQYKIEGMGTIADADRRHAIENLLNDGIGWLGAGIVDGGDIGSGQMNIFAFVVDGALITKCIVPILREHGHLDGAVIAVRRPGEDEGTVVWPEEFTGKFSIA